MSFPKRQSGAADRRKFDGSAGSALLFVLLIQEKYRRPSGVARQALGECLGVGAPPPGLTVALPADIAVNAGEIQRRDRFQPQKPWLFLTVIPE